MRRVFLVLMLPVLLIAALSADVARILAGDDVIGYIHGRQIHVMDVATQEEAELSLGLPVDDFCWDRLGNRMYFLSMNGDTSTLTGYSLDLLTMDKVRLFSKHITPQEGFDGLVEYFSSSINLTSSYDLLVTVNFGFYCAEAELHYMYDFRMNSLSQISEKSDWPSLFKQLPGMEPIDNGHDVTNLYVDGHYELYIRRTVPEGDNWKIVSERLTNTNSIERYRGAEEDKINFVYSPDRKQILFGFSTSYGDLMHGDTHIINIDGTGQHPVAIDNQLGNDLIYTWTNDSRLIYIGSDDEAQADDGSGWSSVIKIRDQKGSTTVLKNASEYVHSLHFREIGHFIWEYKGVSSTCAGFKQALQQVSEIVDSNKAWLWEGENRLYTSCFINDILLGQYIEFYEDHVDLTGLMASIGSDPGLMIEQGRAFLDKQGVKYQDFDPSKLQQYADFTLTNLEEFHLLVDKVIAMLEIYRNALSDESTISSAESFDSLTQFPTRIMMSLTNAADMERHRQIINDLYKWINEENTKISIFMEELDRLESKY